MSNPLNYLGSVKAPTRAIAREVNDHLNKVGKPLPVYPEMGSSVMWGYNSGGAEHGTGRAIDFMTRNSKSVGDEVAAYLWANRERFGLIHLIWQQRIRSTVTSPGAWRGMADRGSPTENHRDHVHAYFNGKAVSGSSGGSQSTAPAPERTYYKPTGTDLTVKQIQAIVGVKADGAYGRATRKAVAAYQKKLGVTADSLWGPATEKAHFAHIGKKPSKKPKPSTPKAPKFPLPKGHWYGVESSNPKNHSGYYAKDRAGIKQWQQQMKKRGWKIGVDGRFGSESQKVARAFQKEKRLSADGLVGTSTWSASWSAPVT